MCWLNWLQEKRRLLRALLVIQAESLKVLREINHKLRFGPQTKSIAARFSSPSDSGNPNDLNIPGESTMNDLVLIVGQSSTGTAVPLQADGVTPTPGAVVSAQVWTLSDPSLTATTNPDGSVTVAGVAESAAPVSGTLAATVTDPDGTVSELTTSFTVTVGAVPPPPVRTVSLGVSWTPPA